MIKSNAAQDGRNLLIALARIRYKIILNMHPPIGVPIQHTIILPRPVSAACFCIIPTPRMEPTTAWDVETGSFRIVIIVTAMAAARDEIPAVPRSIADSLPIVSIPALPSRIAPRMTKRDARIAAVMNLTIFEETAVPNILAASFAPSDQPR